MTNASPTTTTTPFAMRLEPLGAYPEPIFGAVAVFDQSEASEAHRGFDDGSLAE